MPLVLQLTERFHTAMMGFFFSVGDDDDDDSDDSDSSSDDVLGNSVCTHYSSLGGDTVMPSGLHASLCHTFLVSSFFIFFIDFFMVLVLLTDFVERRYTNFVCIILYCIVL